MSVVNTRETSRRSALATPHRSRTRQVERRQAVSQFDERLLVELAQGGRACWATRRFASSPSTSPVYGGNARSCGLIAGQPSKAGCGRLIQCVGGLPSSALFHSLRIPSCRSATMTSSLSAYPIATRLTLPAVAFKDAFALMAPDARRIPKRFVCHRVTVLEPLSEARLGDHGPRDDISRSA